MESLISDLSSPSHKTYSTGCVQSFTKAGSISYYRKDNSIVHFMLKSIISSSIILELFG